MAMSFEEAQRLTNQNLAKQRKGYLAENAYRQSPEGIQRSKDRVKAIGKGALELTPYATYTDGKSAIENFKKGEYLDGSIDAAFAAAAAVPGAMLAKKGIKSGYKGLKNLFQGPLSPQYNSEGGSVYAAVGINPKKMLKDKAKEMLKRMLAPLSEKPTKTQREKMEDMIEAKLEIQTDYPNSDITFQHSMRPDRDINNFRSRPVNVPNKAAFGQGPGLFGHGLTDASKFEQFGNNVYAIVHPKNKKTFSGPMDTESNLNETFVRTPDIEDLIRVKLRGE